MTEPTNAAPSARRDGAPSLEAVKTITRTATFSAKVLSGDAWNDTRRVLEDTHRVVNHTISGIELLLLGLTSSKIGDTPEERRLLNAFGRTMLHLPVSSTNFGYLLSKACEPGRSYNTAFNNIDQVEGAARKTLEATEISESQRQNAQRTVRDCERAREAMRRFQGGWHPLRDYVERLRCGVIEPILNFEALREQVLSNEPARPIPQRWFNLLLSTAIQRLRSYQELKSEWDHAHESWKRSEPRWLEIKNFEERHARHLPDRTVGAKLEFARAHGAALLAALGETTSLRFGGAPGAGELAAAAISYREFVTQNPHWEGSFERLSRWCELKSSAPTYTRCDPVHHPMWVSLPAPQSGGLWRNLTPAGPNRGSVDLHLLRIANGQVEPVELDRVALGLDSRFAGLSAPTAVTPGPEAARTVIRQYHDAGVDRTLGDVTLGGARIILDNPSGKGPFGAHIEFVVRMEVPRAQYPKNWAAIPDGAKLFVVSFGHLVGDREDRVQVVQKSGDDALVLSRDRLSVRNQDNLRHTGVDGEPKEKTRQHLTGLESIQAHLAELDARRSETGRLARAQSHNQELQRHINNSVRDILRKSAHQIVASAVEQGASYVVVPFLEGARPSRHQDSALNRLFMTKARGMLVEYLEGVCQRASLPLLQVSPFGLQSLCSGCGEVGAVAERQEIEIEQRPPEQRHHAAPLMFGCSCCGKVAPAADNAMELMTARLPHWGSADKRNKFAPKLVAATQLPAAERQRFFRQRREEVLALLRIGSQK